MFAGSWYDHFALNTLCVNSYKAEILLYKLWRPKGFYNFNSSLLSQLALAASFEYLCHGSTLLYFFNSFSAGADFKRRKDYDV